MGILNRTPDSFFDQGGYYRFDDFLRKAEQLVIDGADLLDVGGVKAGPGDEVTEAEELDRVVPAIEALSRALRRSGLRRHLAGLGRQGGVRRGCGRRQRHQRLRRPRVPPRRCCGRCVGRRDPHPARSEGPRSESRVRGRRRFRRRVLRRSSRAGRTGRHPTRADHRRRRSRPRQDRTAIVGAAPGVGRPRVARLPGVALRVEQAIPRSPARPRGGGSTRGHDRCTCTRHRARLSHPPPRDDVRGARRTADVLAALLEAAA